MLFQPGVRVEFKHPNHDALPAEFVRYMAGNRYAIITVSPNGETRDIRVRVEDLRFPS